MSLIAASDVEPVDPQTGAEGAPDPAMRVAVLNLRFLLAVSVLIGAVVRFLPVAGSANPLNDGGLFAHMASDLSGNGFALPAFTTYNGEAIPFAYPPLAIYLTSAIAALLGIDSIAVLGWLPALLSTASVLALFLVASEILQSRWRGLVAAAAFALMPHSYLWLVGGGGLTRSLGLLLALLGLQQGVRMMRAHEPRNIAATGALGGLTLLSHPQAALFLAASLLILVGFHAYRGPRRTIVQNLVLAGIGGVVVASPWLVAVISTHGFAPLVSAGTTSFAPEIGLSQLFGLRFADGSVLDLMTALGVLGIIIRVARGQLMIPIWLMVTMLVDPRAGTTYAAVPLALSVVPILGERLQWTVAATGRSASLETETLPSLLRRHPAAAVILALVLFVTLRTAARTAVDPETPLHGLAADHKVAMRWVSGHVTADQRFAIVTGTSWEYDYISEWFPALAERTSAATVQGSEWRGLPAFLDRLAAYRQLQSCADRTAACLEQWAERWDETSTYAFLPKGALFGPRSAADCCPALRETLRLSDRWVLLYDGPGASIFAPVDVVAAGTPVAGTSR
jgi:hypothetical protein